MTVDDVFVERFGKTLMTPFRCATKTRPSGEKRTLTAPLRPVRTTLSWKPPGTEPARACSGCPSSRRTAADTTIPRPTPLLVTTPRPPLARAYRVSTSQIAAFQANRASGARPQAAQRRSQRVGGVAITGGAVDEIPPRQPGGDEAQRGQRRRPAHVPAEHPGLCTTLHLSALGARPPRRGRAAPDVQELRLRRQPQLPAAPPNTEAEVEV